MIVNIDGIPIEFFFTPASCADVVAFRFFALELPKGSAIYSDKAYNDYRVEDSLRDHLDITMVPKRKKNSLRKNSPDKEFQLSLYRNRVETTFSRISNLLPRYIRASTEKGFCLKVFFFILAYTY